ncbi:MAG TPA: hypothetical protein VM492_06895, partial [Sumerlaeia bacterium]|nr:hypothetical protein [Sumerlaeia bacterium]
MNEPLARERPACERLALSPVASVWAVARLTWLDFLRRKDFYVVAVFMLLFVLATAVVRIIGIDKA